MDSGDLRGQRAELVRAVAADRVHGAYLFEGPAGTGRGATALWLARLLVCREPGNGPCERCPDCLRSAPTEEGNALGSHADLRLIEPDGALIKVDQVRALQRDLSLAPNEGGRRVAVLLGAERLNAAAANALLKTLEEPPARTTLILVAEHADGLPATVRSRTVRIRFAPEAESAVAEALQREGFAESDAWLAASLGGWTGRGRSRLPTCSTWPRPSAARGARRANTRRSCSRCTAQSRGDASRRRPAREIGAPPSAGWSAPRPASAPTRSSCAAT
jgi:DNA polymerase III delta' subunit